MNFTLVFEIAIMLLSLRVGIGPVLSRLEIVLESFTISFRNFPLDAFFNNGIGLLGFGLFPVPYAVVLLCLEGEFCFTHAAE